MATSASIWRMEKNEKYQKLLTAFADDDILESFNIAVKSMTYLNRNGKFENLFISYNPFLFHFIAALLMHKFEAHAATDVTGFGLLGHAKNLVEFQKQKLLFKIEKLPIIKNVLKFAALLGQSTKLTAGKSVETSGGLLICLSSESAEEYCKEFEQVTNGEQKAFIVGKIVESDKSTAILSEDVEYIEVAF